MKKLLLTLAFVSAWGLVREKRLDAQTFTTLYNFSTLSGTDIYTATNSDGAEPFAALLLSSNTLFGAASGGGPAGDGTVFALNTDGTGFTVLYGFAGTGDGAAPFAQLASSGNTLYGTTYYGNGYEGNGTVFQVNKDGSDFGVLATLNGLQGITLSGDTLYVSASVTSFEDSDSGAVWELNTDGSGLAPVYSFPEAELNADYTFTNSAGYSPLYPPILSGNVLYGTTEEGGASGSGTIFKVNADGSGFTDLHTFTELSGPYVTNLDGDNPGGVILSGNTLYGTASGGGEAGAGTVFAVNTDGGDFRVLHAFPASYRSPNTNVEGSSVSPYIAISGNTLYGTTIFGGSASNGTVFALNTDGSGFRVLHEFSAFSGANSTNADGGDPYGGLIVSGNTLYGTTARGGSGGSGTIYSISLPAQLGITASGGNVILTWPTNVTGLTLQSADSLVAPIVWTAVSPTPVVVNGLNTVTNAVTGSQRFYRLGQ